MPRKIRMVVAFAGRFPSEKADSLFAHENARAFAKLGIDTTLVSPRRFKRGTLGERPYNVVYLPTLDLALIPVIWEVAHYVNLFVFSCMLYLWLTWHADKDTFVLSNEPFVLLMASFATRNILYEIHTIPTSGEWVCRAALSRALLALPISGWNAEYAERNGVPRERIVISRSAVDTETFKELDKRTAREALGLEQNARIAVYTWHLYGWKGVDTLAKAARLVPDVQVIFVGGTEQDVARFQSAHASVSNIRVAGRVPHKDVPLWQAAADVLVIPNSAKEEISVHHTSPMKLFEYMASQRPILASDLPSIREILTDETGYFATADDPRSFAGALQHIFSAPEEAMRRALAARAVAEHNTWENRARTIVERLNVASA